MNRLSCSLKEVGTSKVGGRTGLGTGRTDEVEVVIMRKKVGT